ncbi:hypothetical protein, partial [Phenylobacterium sp.]|uniref:hypothetical protein n=1 Tax=Phenylobacterium sp. TaxID=1871053 RepID=UPI002733A134
FSRLAAGGDGEGGDGGAGDEQLAKDFGGHGPWVPWKRRLERHTKRPEEGTSRTQVRNMPRFALRARL